MNRAQRRVARRQAPASVRSFAAAYQCPDCLAETTYPVADQHGVWHIDVRHDDTCPIFRRLRAERRPTGQLRGGAVKAARVCQSRRLRDGRPLVEVSCPHCDSMHWLLTDGTTLAYCLSHVNLPMFIEGLGEQVR